MEDNPFQRFKAEWLYRRDIHRQRKRAAAVAREQIEEAQRSQRLAQGEATVGDTVGEWARQSPVSGKMVVRVFLLLLLAALCVSGYILYQKQMHIRALYRRLANSRTVLVRVGDVEIKKGELENSMWERHGQRDLLLETLLILLRDASRSVSVESREFRTLKDEERKGKSLSLSEEADFLEEKILVSKVPESEKRDFYNANKEELAIYELSSLRFESADKAEQFVEAFLKGMSPDQAAEEYSLDSHPVMMPPIMAVDLPTELGVFHARAIEALDRGRYSSPLPTRDGQFIIYRIHLMETDYDLVLPAINTVFARRGRDELRRNLVESANIVSEQITPKQLIELKL